MACVESGLREEGASRDGPHELWTPKEGVSWDDPRGGGVSGDGPRGLGTQRGGVSPDSPCCGSSLHLGPAVAAGPWLLPCPIPITPGASGQGF